MSDHTIPSYRVRPERRALPWRAVSLSAGGLAVLLAVSALGWGLLRPVGPGGPPLVEAERAPLRVRPSDPGGLRVANQEERIFETGRGRAAAEPPAARLAPAPESPDLEGLRRAAFPPAPPPGDRPVYVNPSLPAPEPEPSAAVTAPVQPTLVQPALVQPAAAPPTGRFAVQLGAVGSQAGAQAEWERLRRRMPELLADRQPAVSRLERGEGQAPLWRLRTGGFADAEAARGFCEAARGRGAPCLVVSP